MHVSFLIMEPDALTPQDFQNPVLIELSLKERWLPRVLRFFHPVCSETPAIRKNALLPEPAITYIIIQLWEKSIIYWVKAVFFQKNDQKLRFCPSIRLKKKNTYLERSSLTAKNGLKSRFSDICRKMAFCQICSIT